MQKSGLIEIIPLMYTSAVWDLYSHPESPQGALLWGLSAAVSMAGFLFLSWAPSGLTIRLAAMWWLDGCKILFFFFFTDKAGNIFSSLMMRYISTYPRNDFKEPRLLHPPIQRKALTSLTWDVYFSLINSEVLMFLPPPFLQKLLNVLTPLLPLQKAPWGYLLGLSPQKVCWIKCNSQLLGWAFFLVKRSLKTILDLDTKQGVPEGTARLVNWIKAT